MKKSLLALLIMLATATLAHAENVQFLEKALGGLEIRAYPDFRNNIGWEADIKNYPTLIQFDNLGLGIKCDIRPISGNRPPGVDFQTINFNLWPVISYDIDSRQTATFGWYHWSEHWYHRDKGWLMNVNMLAADYTYTGEKDKIYLFLGDTYDGSDYPVNWMAQSSYQRKFLGFIEPGIFVNAIRYNRTMLFVADFQLAINFRDKYSVIGGYKVGDAPMVLLQPTGPYWGFRWDWK